jgi:hypothetical protein
LVAYIFAVVVVMVVVVVVVGSLIRSKTVVTMTVQVYFDLSAA